MASPSCGFNIDFPPGYIPGGKLFSLKSKLFSKSQRPKIAWEKKILVLTAIVRKL